MKRSLFIIVLSMMLLSAVAQNPFKHDYGKVWTTKLFLSKPDGNGGCLINNTFEEALQHIKAADQLSLGVKKIVYLVGWQYMGHDDKYPAFFEVNDLLKRENDKSGLESLRWLIKEAKKYNTLVSLHINMTDAYDDSPLWDYYVENDLISKNRDGSLMVIGEYNNRKAYQINYCKEWMSGVTQWRIDKLLELLPEIKEAKTIHADAWITRASEGHNETIVKEALYQQKAALYWRAKGIDITTEWAMDYMIGFVPLYWHFNGYQQADYMSQPASICCGVGLNPDLKNSDFGLGFLFGESCYGEPFWGKSFWTKDRKIEEDFFLKFPQFYFLNQYERLRVEGEGDERIAYYGGGVEVSLADSTVTQWGRVLRKGNTIFMPALWRNDRGVIVYSADRSGMHTFDVPVEWGKAQKVQVLEITKNGLNPKEELTIKDNKLDLSIELKNAYYIIPYLNRY